MLLAVAAVPSLALGAFSLTHAEVVDRQAGWLLALPGRDPAGGHPRRAPLPPRGPARRSPGGRVWSSGSRSPACVRSCSSGRRRCRRPRGWTASARRAGSPDRGARGASSSDWTGCRAGCAARVASRAAAARRRAAVIGGTAALAGRPAGRRAPGRHRGRRAPPGHRGGEAARSPHLHERLTAVEVGQREDRARLHEIDATVAGIASAQQLMHDGGWPPTAARRSPR